jgi:hypothetical protein
MAVTLEKGDGVRKIFGILIMIYLSLSCRLFSPPMPVVEPPLQTGPAATSEPAAPDAITLEGLYAEYAGDSEAAKGLGAYLNAGGAVAPLEGLLNGIQTGSAERVKAQVIERDLTGDGCADVLVSLALPSVPGYGDAILAVYVCQGERYLRHGLFGRVGAGGRGEGLYEGGGASIELVEDLNADGVPEIAFFVASLGELYLAEWDGAGFSSLVERVDELGFPSSYIPAQEGAFEFTDVDDDGTLEVLLTDPPGLWRWDGSLYQPAPE